MPDYSMFAYSGFSSEVITRATALANVAYAVYSVGYTRNFLVMNIGEKAIPICLISTKQNDRIIALEIILFVLIVIAGGLEFFLIHILVRGKRIRMLCFVSPIHFFNHLFFLVVW